MLWVDPGCHGSWQRCKKCWCRNSSLLSAPDRFLVCVHRVLHFLASFRTGSESPVAVHYIETARISCLVSSYGLLVKQVWLAAEATQLVRFGIVSAVI